MRYGGELPYFSTKELGCRHCGIVALDSRFAACLVFLRYEWGKPLAPTSVCRCPEHNTKEGGHPKSLHLTENPHHKGATGTMAIDIAWNTWDNMEKERFYRMAKAQRWACGFHNSFIHLDRRVDIGLPRATFLYGAWNNQIPM